MKMRLYQISISNFITFIGYFKDVVYRLCDNHAIDWSRVLSKQRRRIHGFGFEDRKADELR